MIYISYIYISKKAQGAHVHKRGTNNDDTVFQKTSQ